MQLNKILVKILAGTFRLASIVAKPVSRISELAFTFIGKGFFLALIFPGYKCYHWLKYRIMNSYSPSQRSAFPILTKRSFAHVFLLVIGCAVVSNNISASKLRQDDFGANTVISAIVSQSDYESLVTDTALPITGQPKVNSYIDKSTAVSGQKTTGVNDVSGAQVALESGLATITQGGAAVIKPNIIQSIPTGTFVADSGVSRSEIVVYRVIAGDNLSLIAKKFGVSVETILWQNGLTATSLIRQGQTLQILPITGVAHAVVSGQTIGQIAKKYGVDPSKITAFNNLSDSAVLKVGQQLIIPGGRKASVYQSVQATPKSAPIAQLFTPSESRISASGIVWPTTIHRITQYFSLRHTGLDLGIPRMTPLYAVADGTVALAGWSTGYGNNVVIDHGNGMKTRYGHQTKLLVSAGEQVEQGQQIGWSGSTGWSTGPHLHFEVIVNGVRKNPLAYLP